MFVDGEADRAQIYGMEKTASLPFRPFIRVLTERSRPQPIFLVAWTGVDFWLRVEVPTDALIRSPAQRQREVGRIIREHYDEWGKRCGPFGLITGYVFHSLSDRATCYSIEGSPLSGAAPPILRGEVSFGLR